MVGGWGVREKRGVEKQVERQRDNIIVYTCGLVHFLSP